MPAINPKSVAEFLAKPRDSHDWMKELPTYVLSRKLREVGIDPRPPDQLPFSKHQKVCLLLGVSYPGFAFWLDMGLGKSRIALRLFRHFHDAGEVSGCLILAKSEAAVIAWEDEIKKWESDLPYTLLLKSMSTEQKWDALNEFEGGVIVGSYGGVTRMLCKLVENTKKKRNQLRMDPKRVRQMTKLIGCLVPDEATTLANQDSRISQLFYHLSKACRFRWELAGIPFGRDPTMLWRQLYLIDRGETLGETLGLFRAAFFKTKKNYWGGFEHTFIKEKEKQLHKILKHRSISYEEGEVKDIAKVVTKVERLFLPAEAKTYYKRFVAEIKKQRADLVERRGSFVRMRQVASGYVGFRDDETGEKAELEFATNPKLERLMELIEEVPPGRKFVIWYEYTHTARLITAMLTKAKVRHQWLYGKTTKDVRRIQDTFDRDDRDRGLLANHRVAAYSLNLQRANYEFIVEEPVSPIDARQMRKRLARTGQTRTVFRYELVMVGTADESIREFHREGKDLFEAIVRSPEEVV